MNHHEVKIGIIADAQYADCPPDVGANRYYQLALPRLEEAVTTFNEHQVDLILNLGDLIDRGWSNFHRALDVLSAAKSPVFHVPGNHDFGVDPAHLDEVRPLLAPEDTGFPHRHQLTRELRLLVLDATVISLYATASDTPLHLEASGWLTELSNHAKPYAKSYNGGLGADQRHWLRHELADAKQLGEHVIIACHQPIYGGDEKFHLWDTEKTAQILKRSPDTALAWLAGHCHEANHLKVDGTLHWQAAAMVDTRDQNAYTILHIHGDDLHFEGFGRQPSFFVD